MVIDSGNVFSHTMSILEFYGVTHDIQRIHLTSRDTVVHVQKILAKKGYNFTTNMELEIVKDIKETMCYVVKYFEHTKKQAEDIHSCGKNTNHPTRRKY